MSKQNTDMDSPFTTKLLPKGLSPEAPLKLENPVHQEILELEADNRFPHQHEVRSYFSFKRLEASTVRRFPFLKVLRLGKGKFLELPKLPKFSRLSNRVLGALAMVIMVGGLWIGQNSQNLFYADSSIVNKESPLAFDGAVYPFAKSPNWFATGGKNSRLYSEYKPSELVDAPKYDIALMQKDEWEKNIVNTKITYSVVYQGNYKYDHIENGGSHPAVDIKLPEGTPVYSIAHGLVVKSQDLTSGFGKHIVVRHDKVPKYGTVYSSYSHLSAREVKVGDVVLKGQKIGEVGSSGNSTTPHVHFQIDLASAPFRPYWPFTTAEATAQKVNFFEAINMGLGKEKGAQYTIHPFVFISENLTGSRLPTSSDLKASAVGVSTSKPSVTLTSNSTPKPNTPTPKSEILSGYSVLVAPSKILVGDTVYVSIYAKNQNNNWCQTCSDSGTISYVQNGKKQTISYNLSNGIAEQKIILNEEGTTTFSINGSKETKTVLVQVLPRPTSLPTLKATIAATPNPTSAPISLKGNVFKDVSSNHPDAAAIAYMKSKGIISGYSDGNFKPDNKVNRAESLKMIFKSLNVGTNRIVSNPFTDVSSSDWFKPYIITAYDLTLAQGYSDGTFRPEKNVTRSEFFKILSKALHVDISSLPEKNPFADVERTTWVAPYAQWAKEKRLLDFGLNFNPNAPMTRAEIAEALYRTIK